MMKYQETSDYTFFLDKNYFVFDHKEEEDVLHIYVKSKRELCRCPMCGMESRKLHATYKRTLQDIPIRCKQTFLHANVYKYECVNPECSCKVFMEELPFAKPSQVRTDALNVLILGVSMFLSNEGASKVLSLLGIRISNDSIQRLYPERADLRHSNLRFKGPSPDRTSGRTRRKAVPGMAGEP